MLVMVALFSKSFVCFRCVSVPSEHSVVVAVDTSSIGHGAEDENVKVKFETLRAMDQGDTINMDSHMSERVSLYIFTLSRVSLAKTNFFVARFQQQSVGEDEHSMHTMMITPELLGLIPSSSGHSGK